MGVGVRNRSHNRTTTNSSDPRSVSVGNRSSLLQRAVGFHPVSKRRESEFPPTEKRSTLMWVFLSSIPCYFFIVKQQKSGAFTPSKGFRLGACCLTILICLILLNVLRVRCDHATPKFSDLKVSVYRMKGKRLQDER